jgi:hypothetical protein
VFIINILLHFRNVTLCLAINIHYVPTEKKKLPCRVSCRYFSVFCSCYDLIQNLLFQSPLSNMENKYAGRNLGLASCVNTKCCLSSNTNNTDTARLIVMF